MHKLMSRFIVPPPSHTPSSDAELTLGVLILGIIIIVALGFIFIAFIAVVDWLLFDVRDYDDLVRGIESVRDFFRRWRKIFADIWQKGKDGTDDRHA